MSDVGSTHSRPRSAQSTTKSTSEISIHEVLTNAEARSRNAAVVCMQETLAIKVGQKYLPSEFIGTHENMTNFLEKPWVMNLVCWNR
jgi:hypothetical protein